MKSVQLSCNVSRGRGSHHLALGRGLRVRSRGRGRWRGRRRGRVSWPRPGLREEHRDPAPALAAPRHPAAVLQRQAVPGPRTCTRILNLPTPASECGPAPGLLAHSSPVTASPRDHAHCAPPPGPSLVPPSQRERVAGSPAAGTRVI